MMQSKTKKKQHKFNPPPGSLSFTFNQHIAPSSETSKWPFCTSCLQSWLETCSVACEVTSGGQFFTRRRNNTLWRFKLGASCFWVFKPTKYEKFKKTFRSLKERLSTWAWKTGENNRETCCNWICYLFSLSQWTLKKKFEIYFFY